MRKLRLIGLGLLIPFFCPLVAFAQAAGTPQNSIELDIYNLASGVYNSLANPSQQPFYPVWVTYQRALTDHLALGVVVGTVVNTATATLGTGYYISPGIGLDWHPFDDGLRGFYCGPFLGGTYSIQDMGSPIGNPASITASLNGGAILGYEFQLPLSLVIDIAAEGFAEFAAIGWSGVGFTGNLQINFGIQF